jgi:hypothetical protein
VPRIDIDDTAAFQQTCGTRFRGEPGTIQCRRARENRDGIVFPDAQVNLRPEFVFAEPAAQIHQPLGFAIEEILTVNFDHEEIMQVLTLRGQQRCPDRVIRGCAPNIVRDQPLQKIRPVRTANQDKAA